MEFNNELDICDLDPSKICDSCEKCLGIDTKDYREIRIDGVVDEDTASLNEFDEYNIFNLEEVEEEDTDATNEYEFIEDIEEIRDILYEENEENSNNQDA
ncbi:MAG: hypothetical protein RSA01_07370 [Clostridium sp.]|uniref:hypothetical protein n=1 Tax=Clostridium sp. TaxID=1506 RepID=UPI002FC69120